MESCYEGKQPDSVCLNAETMGIKSLFQGRCGATLCEPFEFEINVKPPGAQIEFSLTILQFKWWQNQISVDAYNLNASQVIWWAPEENFLVVVWLMPSLTSKKENSIQIMWWFNSYSRI